MRTLLAAIVLLLSRLFLGAQTPADHPTVFLIVMENHPWSTNANSEHPAIKGNKNAPYINGTLLPLGAHAEQQFAHIKDFTNSLPNYIWLECGQNFFNNNNPPNKSHVPKGTPHLTSLFDQAGIPWKTYQEGIDGKSCPVRDIDKGKYAVRHNPFMYFLDVTSNEAYCNEHVRPYSELAADLRDNKVKGYNFIKPNLIHDMHDGTVKQGDDWLSKELPVILASQAYSDGAIIFVTWDESELGDYPIGMIVLSKRVKSAGYSNTIKYTHSSTLKTLQGLFGITPTLGDTASDKVADHSDFFQPGTIQVTSVSDKAPTTPIPFAKKVTGKDNQEGDETFTVTMPVKHAGAQDGSAGIAIGQDHFIGASDENNVLRLYTSDDAEAGKELLDLNPLLGFGKEGGEFKECDIEGAAQMDDLIFWIGSHGLNKKGKVKKSRRVLFATALSGSGADVQLKLKGVPGKSLMDAFMKIPELKSAAGIKPEDEGGLNIESLCAKGGSLLIGFRNPVSGGGALIVPLTNPKEVIAGKSPVLGKSFRLNLEGRGIRDMTRWHNQFLIVAGDYKDRAAPGAKTPKLFKWSGDPKDSPVPMEGEFGNLNPEAALVYGQEGHERLQLLSDDGGESFRSVWVKEAGSQ